MAMDDQTCCSKHRGPQATARCPGGSDALKEGGACAARCSAGRAGMPPALLPAALVAAALGAGPAAAQDWSGNFTLFGWFPVIEGAQEGRDGTPIIDLDSRDVLDALDFALFATGEARRDRFGILFDFAYVELGTDGQARAPFTAEASADTRLYFGSLAGTYRLQGDVDSYIDAYAGVRYYDATVDFDVSLLDGGVRRSFSPGANWFDPIIGVKGRYPLSERWSVTGFGDIGGFGISGASDLTWQAYTGVNYAFSEQFAGNLGYRYMSIDYDDEITLDIDIHGPVLGLTYRF
jgi:opacity protein-like surface antigen